MPEINYYYDSEKNYFVLFTVAGNRIITYGKRTFTDSKKVKSILHGSGKTSRNDFHVSRILDAIRDKKGIFVMMSKAISNDLNKGGK